MHDHLHAYLEHLRSERQVSRHTLDGYSRDLAKLLAFCEREQIVAWGAPDTPRPRRRCVPPNLARPSSPRHPVVQGEGEGRLDFPPPPGERGREGGIERGRG